MNPDSVVIRGLTKEDFLSLQPQRKRGKTPSPQFIELYKLQPPGGMLLSHAGVKCRKFKGDKEKGTSNSCTIDNIIIRLRKTFPNRTYSVMHTNGHDSDVAIWCQEKVLIKVELDNGTEEIKRDMNLEAAASVYAHL